jgi:uncharacterized protein YndB with AHSA1/START domain
MQNHSEERVIWADIVIEAKIDAVWEAWTTTEGVLSFFAPGCNIDLRIDGPYEMFFALEAEQGSRGGEGVKILAIQPQKMLSFTWNAPPNLSNVRQQRTHVIVRFAELTEGQTRVTLRHDGWGEGKEWGQAFAYFSRAWKDVVLPRLQYRFSVGPIDWDNPPEFGLE